MSVCVYVMFSLLVQKLPEFSDATIVRSRTPEVKRTHVQPVNLPRASCHEAYRFSPPAPSWLTLAECTIMRRRDTTTIRYADAVAVAVLLLMMMMTTDVTTLATLIQHQQQLGFDHHFPSPAGGVFPWKMSSAGNQRPFFFVAAFFLYMMPDRPRVPPLRLARHQVSHPGDP